MKKYQGVNLINKKIILPACFIVLFLMVFNFQNVFAHEAINVGDYQIEIGWVTEPAIAGQMNAVVVNVSTADEQPVEDVSNLVVSVEYGGQSKTLLLQPLGEDTPGQFIAPILPTIPGEYTIKLGGKLGDTDVSAEVQPEAVQIPDTVQFPLVEVSSQNSGLGMTGWLSILGVILGLAGFGMGFMALRKKS